MHRDPVFSKGVSQMTAFCFGALTNLAQSSHHRENRSAHWDGRMPLILSPALHSEQTKKSQLSASPLGRKELIHASSNPSSPGLHKGMASVLYSTGNYIQYPVINHNGKEYKGENVCMCITESLCHTAESGTTLYINYTSIKEK